MKWRKLGRVFVATAHSEWIYSHGVVPIAQHLGEYRYRIYFSPRDRQGRSNLSWLEIDIRDPTKILRLSKEPVIAPGAAGYFDDRGAMGCWIVEHEDKELLYYQGWNLGVTVGFYVAVGMATRPVGNLDRPFERISTGPILDRCMSEPVFIACPAVMVENGKWRMWYQSGKAWSYQANRPVPSYDIRYAESADGIHWTLTNKQVVTFKYSNEVAITRFCPLREPDGAYSAWYSFRGNDWGYRIGFATSQDGCTWQRQDEEAGISCDENSWEESMICYPFVFDTEAGRFMLYNGGRFGSAGFGIAALEQS